MLSSISMLLAAATFTTSLSINRRQDPGMQAIPPTALADNTFSNGQAYYDKGNNLTQTGNETGVYPPEYGARSIDLPFYRYYNGNLKLFPQNELNSLDYLSDNWRGGPTVGSPGGGTDSASQSACGIPNNAFFDSHVAIHPYFLKFAGLDRYCMQDVCVAFWKEDGSSDMIAKVTDICSTDPSDPTSCATPSDIKITKGKAFVLEGWAFKALSDPSITVQSVPELQGAQYPDRVWWFFTKCWADATVQPAYGPNWFAQPPLPNNLAQAQHTAFQQYLNNQASYPARGWSTYPNAGYNPVRDASTCLPIDDWVPGQPDPIWKPIAGGKGYSGKF